MDFEQHLRGILDENISVNEYNIRLRNARRELVLHDNKRTIEDIMKRKNEFWDMNGIDVIKIIRNDYGFSLTIAHKIYSDLRTDRY